MNPRLLLLVGGALLLGSGQAARAEYLWTSSAYFTPGGSPQTTGSGQLIFELAPVGSGVGLTAPADLTDGFETARGYVLRYIAGAADVNQQVRITWTADRDFLSLGEPSYTTIGLDFQAELVGEGGGVSLSYSATTQHKLIGPGSDVTVSSDDPIELSPGNATATVSASGTSATFVALNNVTDSLRQTVEFDLTPTQAGQEVRIYFTPNGVISTGHNVGDVSPVPAPSALTLCLSAVPVLGAMWLRSGRGKRT